MAGVNTHGNFMDVPEVAGVMEYPIETMRLPSRVCSALHKNGCRTVRDVATRNIESIRKMKYIGEKSAEEVLQRPQKILCNRQRMTV